MIKNLIALKVRWYGNALIKALYEYSVAVLLLGTIFVFGVINPLLISKPIEVLLGNSLSASSTGLHLFVLNLIFIILFSSQKRMIFSQEFESFIQALPINKTIDRISSVFILFISNNFLWIILLAGAYTAFSSQPKLMVVVETVYLMGSLLMIQLCLYEKNISKFILLCLSNLAFVFTKSYLSTDWFIITALLLTFTILAVGLTEIRPITLSNKGDKPSQIPPFLRGPILSVQFAMLRPYRNLLLIKIALSVAAQSLTAVIVTHTENPNLIYLIVLCNYVTICIMSSFSRILALETQKMAPYFSNLPIEKFYWFKKNQVVNLFLTIVIIFPCTLFALSSSVLSIWMFLYMVFAITVINTTVYYLNFKQIRNITLRLFFIVLGLYAIQFLIG